MGGRVDVKSKLGKGTKFTIKIRTKCFPIETEIVGVSKSEAGNLGRSSLLSPQNRKSSGFES